jgi:hypothetical protein
MRKLVRSAAVFVFAAAFLSLPAHAADAETIPIHKEMANLAIVRAQAGHKYAPATSLEAPFQRIADSFKHKDLVGFQVDKKTGTLTVALNDNSHLVRPVTFGAVKDCYKDNTTYQSSEVISEASLQTAVHRTLLKWTKERYVAYVNLKDYDGRIIPRGELTTEVCLDQKQKQ